MPSGQHLKHLNPSIFHGGHGLGHGFPAGKLTTRPKVVSDQALLPKRLTRRPKKLQWSSFHQEIYNCEVRLTEEMQMKRNL